MSPILVRPVREQLEHDRVIRLLQAKYKRKYDALINLGLEQTAPVPGAMGPIFPDVVLYSTDRTRKLAGTVEVETGESVNNLEAMSQWVAFGKLKAPFHLYVPTQSIDTARRMCQDMNVPVAEIWTFHTVGDQIRFTMVYRSPQAAAMESKAAAAAPAAAKAAPKAASGKQADAKPAAKNAAGKPAASKTAAGNGRARTAAPASSGRTATARRKPAPAKPRAAAAKASRTTRGVAKKKAAARTSRTQKRK